MKKKILIMGDYPEEGETITEGIMRSVYLTVNALKEIAPEYDIQVLSIPSSSWMKRYPILVPKFLYKLSVLRQIKRFNLDLIHANGTGWDYGYPAVSYKGCPVLLTIHGISHNESKYWIGLKGAWHRWNNRRIEKYVLKNAVNTTAVSWYVAEEIFPYLNLAVTDIISNPVDPKFFGITKSQYPNRLLFVGGIEERKGLDVLIKAMPAIEENVPNVSLHIVGGTRNYTYCNMLKGWSFGDPHITWLGKVSEEQLLKEYNEAAIFVLPSYEESQGVVLLEAMASGTPVVATRSGGAVSVIDDYRTGLLVDCGDSKTLAERIITLLDNQTSRELLADAGKKEAHKYLPENIARQYFRIYKELLR